MRPQILALTGAVLLSTFAPVSADDVTVRGQTVTEDGSPLADAAVELRAVASAHEAGVRELRGEETETVSTISDEGGLFELRLPAGLWRLQSSAPRRAPYLSLYLILVEDTHLGPLTLPRGDQREIRVTDAQGKAVTDAAIVVEPSFIAMPYERRTSPAGTVDLLISGADARRWTDARISAFQTGFAPTRVRGGTSTLVLRRGEPRMVEVRDKQGAPVAGALVRVGPARAGVSWPLAVTGDDGRAVVAVAGDDLQVRASTAAGDQGLLPLHAEPGDTQDDLHVVVVSPPLLVEGRVVDADRREPIAGAFVSVQGKNDTVWTDAQGAFVLGVHPAGRRRVVVQAVARGHFESTVQVAENGRLLPGEVKLVLNPALRLHGRVVDQAGAPVGGADVAYGHKPDGELAAILDNRTHTVSDTDGTFTVPAHANQVNLLQVRRRGFLAESRRVGVDPARPDAVVEVVLRRDHGAFGHVFDPDHQPVAGAEVQLATTADPRARYPLRGAGNPLRAVTDDQGRFTITDLAPDALFNLQVRAPSFAVATVLGARGEQTPDGLDLGTVVLTPGVDLEGRTVDPEGRPISGVRLFAMHRQAGARFSGLSESFEFPEVQSDDHGRFVFPDRTPGDALSLEARHPGYARVEHLAVDVPPDAPMTITLIPAGTVRGRVTDASGAGVAGAKVTVWNFKASGAGSGRGFPTNADGRFEQDGVSPGDRLEIHVAADGFGPLIRELALRPGEVTDEILLVLEPAVELSGRVLAASGDPVADAKVMVLDERMRTQIPNTATDSGGFFQLPSLPEWTMMVYVDADGFERHDQPVEVRRGMEPLTITLRRAPTRWDVQGHVLFAGDGVAEARVALTDPQHGNRKQGAVTKVDGSFTLQAVDGDYRLVVTRAPGYRQVGSAPEVRVAGAPVTGLVLDLEEGGSVIQGYVLGIEPSERQVRVFLGDPRRSIRERYHYPVDHEGRYRIDDAPLGTWELHARDLVSGRQSTFRRVRVEGHGEQVVDLEFFPGVTLTGTVRLDGEPLRAASVRLEDGPEVRMTVTDHLGAFRIDDVQTGRYQLTVMDDRSGLGYRREMELHKGENVEIDVMSHRLRGRVVDAADGRPLAGVLIHVGDVTPWFHEHRTRDDGSFVVEPVAQGNWELEAMLEGYAVVRQTVEVVEGASPADVEIALEPEARVTLTVRRADNQPVQRVWVAGDSLGIRTSLRVDERGEFVVPGLSKGTWRLTLGAQNTATVSVDVTSPGIAGPVLLPPPGLLEVRVSSHEGDGWLGSVTVLDDNGQPFTTFDRSVRTMQQVWPLRGGRASVPDLPPGTWTVRVTLGNDTTFEGRVVTPPGGGTVTLDLN